MESTISPDVGRDGPVAFIGAGRMGRAMVRRLVASGREVRVHARRPEARRDLVSLGAHVEGDVSATLGTADVVISCLFDERQVRDVILSGVLPSMRPGGVLVVHTTMGPDLARNLADRGAEGGVSVLDAPISGAADDIDNCRLTVMASGASGALERARPFLAAYAGRIVSTGPVGVASAIKLVNNLLFAANAQLVAEAVALGRQLGVDTALLLDVLKASSGGSRAADRVVENGSIETFETRVREFLSKDAHLALAMARAQGVEPTVLRHVVAEGPLSLVAVGGHLDHEQEPE